MQGERKRPTEQDFESAGRHSRRKRKSILLCWQTALVTRLLANMWCYVERLETILSAKPVSFSQIYCYPAHIFTSPKWEISFIWTHLPYSKHSSLVYLYIFLYIYIYICWIPGSVIPFLAYKIFIQVINKMVNMCSGFLSSLTLTLPWFLFAKL